MNNFRKNLVSRARILAMVVVGGCLLVASQVVYAGGTPPTPEHDLSNGTVRETTRFGVSASLPTGWRAADAPLVPKLTSPRSVAAFGTFEMPVGGGGECGMYPVRALAAMNEGDTLIHIQKTGGTGAAKWFKQAPRRPQAFDLSKLAALRRPNFFLGRWAHRFDFRVGKNYFFVFVAFGARPGGPAVGVAEQVLDSLNFSKRSPAYRGTVSSSE